MKMLLNVNKKANFVIESELGAKCSLFGAHECIFALLVVNSRK